MSSEAVENMACALAIGVGSIGPALSVGNIVSRAIETMGRNPEAAPQIQTNMILGVVFAEAIAIYAMGLASIIFRPIKRSQREPARI